MACGRRLGALDKSLKNGGMHALRPDINYLGPLLLHCKVEQEKNFYLKWLGEELRSFFVVN